MKRTKKKTIKLTVECPYCDGTGLYSGLAEGKGTAVICYQCNGTGAYVYKYSYKDFTGRKRKDGVERVYLKSSYYKIGLGKIVFSDGIGEINMDEEGVSYGEFLHGKMPWHIEKLECPMLADQGACHNIDGFVDKCESLNGVWVSRISECKHQPHKHQCWKRFKAGIKKGR